MRREPRREELFQDPGRKVLRTLGLVTLLTFVASLVSCIEVSDGTWVLQSAATPRDWPTLTPVGEVRIQRYPEYRAALVRETDLGQEGMEPLFGELFRHIKDNDIAMTAPVEMEFGSDGSTKQPTAMAFLYRTTAQGLTGRQGSVRVGDRAVSEFVSIGVRGDYSAENFRAGLDRLTPWLQQERETWQVIGSPRYLGYNGPFVPSFMRYGEVQVPVRRRVRSD